MIGWLKLEESLPALISASRDPEPVVRRSAVSALGFSGNARAAQAIIGALDDPDWMVREIAAETLARATGSDAGPRLIAALGDDYWQVTLKAARSLGKLQVVEAVTVMGPLLNHDVSNLRKEIAGALGEIGHPVRPALSCKVMWTIPTRTYARTCAGRSAGWDAIDGTFNTMRRWRASR